MKVNTIPMLLLSIFLLFVFFFPSFNGDLDTVTQEQRSLYPSTNRTYNLTGSVSILDDDPEQSLKTAGNIIVDDVLENYTWNDWVEKYKWCTGSGTLQDPYIIQEVYIDGQFFGKIYFYYSCIIIRNSDSYFVVRDCTLIHAGDSKYNAGVRLENVTNGIIIYNECNYNKQGVILKKSNGNTVGFNEMVSDFNCTVDYQNSTYGMGPAIFTDNSHNNTIEFNNITNYVEGLKVYRCTYNKFRNNLIINTKYGTVTSYAGIVITETNYTEITENYLVGVSGLHAIDQDETCMGNIIEDNYFNQPIQTSSESTGKIKLEQSNYNVITKNRFFNTYEDYLKYITSNNGEKFPLLLIISISGVCGVVVVAITIIVVVKKR